MSCLYIHLTEPVGGAAPACGRHTQWTLHQPAEGDRQDDERLREDEKGPYEGMTEQFKAASCEVWDKNKLLFEIFYMAYKWQKTSFLHFYNKNMQEKYKKVLVWGGTRNPALD